MKHIKRSIYLTTLLHYIGKSISFLREVYLLPKILSLNELGIYRGIQASIFLLANLDLSKSIVRQFNYWKQNQESQDTFFIYTLFTTTCLYLIIVAGCWSNKELLEAFLNKKSPELITYLPIIIPLSYIILLNITFKSWYMALRKTVWPNFTQHIVLQSLLLLPPLLYYWDIIPFHKMIVAITIPYTFNLLLLLTHLYYTKGFTWSFNWRLLNKKQIYAFCSHSLFILLTSQALLAIHRIDTILILGICGKAKAATYHTAAFVASLLIVPIKVIKQTTVELTASKLAKKSYEELHILYKKITLYQFSLSSLLFLWFYANLDHLLVAFSKETIVEAKQIFILLAIKWLIRNLAYPSEMILILSSYFYLNLITFMLAIVNLMVNYMMIERWGLHGAAISNLTLVVISKSITCWIVWYKLRMQPLSIDIVKITIWTLLMLAMIYYLPNFGLWWIDIGLRTTFFGITIIILARTKSLPPLLQEK